MHRIKKLKVFITLTTIQFGVVLGASKSVAFHSSLPASTETQPAGASGILGDLQEIGNKVYGQAAPTDIRIVIGNVVQMLLGFVGVVFLLLIIYGGMRWMTSGGNEDNIKKAKKIITNATVGLVIVVISYAAASFIFNSLIGAVSEVPVNTGA